MTADAPPLAVPSDLCTMCGARNDEARHGKCEQDADRLDWTGLRRQDVDTDVPLTLFDPGVQGQPAARSAPAPDPYGTLDLFDLDPA